MSDVADLLKRSRSAHQAKDYQTALDLRLEARAADKDKADPEWLEDAVAPKRPGVTGKQYHRIPGLTVREVAAKHDADLEVFYRFKLGEVTNPVLSVQTENPVLVPHQWDVQQSGVTPCFHCGHREDQHHADPDPMEEHCDVEDCTCLGYGPSICKHAFVPTAEKERSCGNCGEVQIAVPTMAVEDSIAFKQLQKEQGK